MNATQKRTASWGFVLAILTWCSAFNVSAADVRWHITSDGSPTLTFSLNPPEANSTNTISFIAPAGDSVYPNSCIASISQGEPLISVDWTHQLIDVTFTPPLPPTTICSLDVLPVSGVDGHFGPLKSGTWIFKVQQNTYAFTVADVPLSLSIELLNNSSSLQLAWPVSGDSFALESTDSISSPNWQSVTNVPVIMDNRNVIQIGTDSGSQFYRLHRLP